MTKKKVDYNDLKDVAYTLFLSGYAQKEIAKKLHISEQTVSRWAKDGEWKDRKTTLLMDKGERLYELYNELSEFNRMIKDKVGYKVADSKEADARRKLITDIKDLETKYNIGEAISIGRDFTSYLKDIDFDFALQVLEAYDGFINHKIEQKKWQK